MKVLVGCEESQEVTKAFRALGHEAWSNDILDCSGGHPEWHLKMDVFEAIKSDSWDMGIFFTPCTYSCNSGLRWMYNEYSLDPRVKREVNAERLSKCKHYATMLKDCLNSGIPKVACENPIPHHFAIGFIGQRYSQLIQPWQFGHGETKATCLWLKNLPYLQYTQIVKQRVARVHRMAPGPERARLRSKTYPGIAKAMAEQWGNLTQTQLF